MTKHDKGLQQGRGRNRMPREREVKEGRAFLFKKYLLYINLNVYKIKRQRVGLETAVLYWSKLPLDFRLNQMCSWRHSIGCKSWQNMRGHNMQLKDRKGRGSRTFTSHNDGLLEKLAHHYLMSNTTSCSSTLKSVGINLSFLHWFSRNFKNI